MRLAPYGLFGGTDGQRARCEVMRDGKVIVLPSKGRMDLRKGDVLTLHTAGGAGYGSPAGRDPRAIAEDVRQGYLSAEAAQAFYRKAP
jgi:N-methylhydantoinase B